MADFCSNEVIVSRTLTKNLIRKEKGDFVVDFNLLIPMPKDLKIDSIMDCGRYINLYLSAISPTTNEIYDYKKISLEELYKKIDLLIIDKKKDDNEHKDEGLRETYLNKYIVDIDENKNSKKDIELGKKYLSNFINYGHFSWYSWCISNWGCKWNGDTMGGTSVYVENDKVHISFSTPWDPPFGIVEKLFELGKEDVIWKYRRDYDTNETTLIWQDGNIIEKLDESSPDVSNEGDIISKIELDPDNYSLLSNESKNNKDIIIRTLNASNGQYFYAIDEINRIIKNNEQLFNNSEIIKALASNPCSIGGFLSNNLYSKEQVMEILEINPELYEDLFPRYHYKDEKKGSFKADYEIGRLVFSKCPDMIQYAYNNLRNDESIALLCIENGLSDYSYLGDEIKKDYKYFDLFVKKIKENIAPKIDNISSSKDFYFCGKDGKFNHLLHFKEDTFLSDRNMLINCIDICPEFFKYASEKLKNDYDIVIKALEKNPYLFYKIGNKIANDQRVIKKAIINGIEVELIDKLNTPLSDDELLLFLSNSRYPLHEPKFKTNNSKILLLAIEKNNEALKYADPSLLNDYDFMIEACQKSDYCFGFASSELKNNKDFVLSVINNSNRFWYYSDIGVNLLNDIDFVDKINSEEIFRYISNNIKNNKTFMMKKIKENYEFMEYAGEKIINDNKLMYQLIKNDPRVLKHLPIICPDIDIEAILNKIIQELGITSEEYLYKIARQRQSGFILNYFPSLKNNIELIKKISKYNPNIIDYASDEIKNNKELQKEILKEHGRPAKVIVKIVVDSNVKDDDTEEISEESKENNEIIEKRRHSYIIFKSLLSGALNGYYQNDVINNFFSNCETKEARCELIENTIMKPQNSMEKFIYVWLYENMNSNFRTKEIDAIKDYLSDVSFKDAICFDCDLKMSDLDNVNIFDLAEKHHQGIWYRKLANLLIKEKSFEEALKYFNKSIELDPYYHGSYIDKAECLNKINKDKSGYLYLLDIQNSELYNKFPKGIFYEKGADFKKKIDNAIKKSEN